jgi:hypothetical protein
MKAFALIGRKNVSMYKTRENIFTSQSKRVACASLLLDNFSVSYGKK